MVLYESFSSQSISYNTDGNQRRIYEEYYYYVEHENEIMILRVRHDYCIKTYTYDQAGRLTSESDGTDTINYTYDAAHNRAGMTVTGTSTQRHIHMIKTTA